MLFLMTIFKINQCWLVVQKLSYNQGCI